MCNNKVLISRSPGTDERVVNEKKRGVRCVQFFFLSRRLSQSVEMSDVWRTYVTPKLWEISEILFVLVSMPSPCWSWNTLNLIIKGLLRMWYTHEHENNCFLKNLSYMTSFLLLFSKWHSLGIFLYFRQSIKSGNYRKSQSTNPSSLPSFSMSSSLSSWCFLYLWYST